METLFLAFLQYPSANLEPPWVLPCPLLTVMKATGNTASLCGMPCHLIVPHTCRLWGCWEFSAKGNQPAPQALSLCLGFHFLPAQLTQEYCVPRHNAHRPPTTCGSSGGLMSLLTDVPAGLPDQRPTLLAVIVSHLVRM